MLCKFEQLYQKFYLESTNVSNTHQDKVSGGGGDYVQNDNEFVWEFTGDAQIDLKKVCFEFVECVCMF